MKTLQSATCDRNSILPQRYLLYLKNGESRGGGGGGVASSMPASRTKDGL